MLDSLFALSTLLLALSLATERLVTILKTIFTSLEDEMGDKTLIEDKPRRLKVQVVSFICAWVTCAFIAKDGFNPLGIISIIPVPNEDGYELPVAFVAFLCMGGSAFWSNVLGYVKAVKDTKKQEIALRRHSLKHNSQH